MLSHRGRLLLGDPIALKETKEVLRVGRRMNDEETWYVLGAGEDARDDAAAKRWLARQGHQAVYRQGV
jgi:hypothetical protein